MADGVADAIVVADDVAYAIADADAISYALYKCSLVTISSSIIINSAIINSRI